MNLGPCAFCGYEDAAHRVWDAVAERSRAGEEAETICWDYGITMDELALYVALSDDAEGR